MDSIRRVYAAHRLPEITVFFAPLIAILAFGLIHSIMAAFGFKRRLRAFTGDRFYEGWYRLLYNGVSVVLLAPISFVILRAPATVLWSVPAPWSTALLGLQGIGVVCLTLSVLQADPLRFAGISQAVAYLRGDPLPLPPEPLQTGGFYALVRHPLYLFSLLALWPMPTMTDTYLGFAIGATLYFIIGSRYEERKLARIFPNYQDYRRRVPWLLPLPRRKPESVA